MISSFDIDYLDRQIYVKLQVKGVSFDSVDFKLDTGCNVVVLNKSSLSE